MRLPEGTKHPKGARHRKPQQVGEYPPRGVRPQRKRNYQGVHREDLNTNTEHIESAEGGGTRERPYTQLSEKYTMPPQDVIEVDLTVTKLPAHVRHRGG